MIIKKFELILVKVQPSPWRHAGQILREQRLHVLLILTYLMRFSLWRTWKARCALSLARLILLHQTQEWRIAGKRLDGGLCIFLKKGSHTRPDSYERRPCSFSSQRIGNEKLPEKPGAEGMCEKSQQTGLLLQRKLPHIRTPALFLIWICSLSMLAQYSRDSY